MRTPYTRLARNLRKNSTEAERHLWKHLRARRLEGLKFKRQEVLGRYIADFICIEKKIVIELDGGQHAVLAEKDIERDAWLGAKGYHVLRFWNNDVFLNTEAVLEMILEACRTPDVD